MKQSVHQYQGSLFTPTTTIVEHPKESPTTNPLTPPTAHPEPLNIEITRDALAAQIIQELVEHRRWEKELTLGATDEELSRALGTCWSSNQRLEIHCNVDPQPHLICTSTTGQELLRLDAPEIATLIRTHVHIPTVPHEEERERRLKQHLDKERNKARTEIFTAVQSILGDKSRKRDQGFTQPFVDLLFTEDCLQEENESATLETITSMLIARQWTRLKAMKTAIQLVERAAGTWRSIERYWLNRRF
ncbi:MAG TPA: hypothetical protein VIT88_06065 [Pyrinomonadaceae bacterium]